MSQSHNYSVSARLGDGGIFVAGGDTSTAAELLAPGAAAWAPAGALAQMRVFPAVSVLAGDAVLVAGGDGPGGSAVASAEVWSRATGFFTGTGPMNVARQAFTLTTLPDGRALAVGGSPALVSGAGSSTTEIYDPATNAWTPAASMPSGRLGQTATLLPNCRVLIVGDHPQAVLYDIGSGTFVPGGTETAGGSGLQRSYHTATLLVDGRVLIAGGVDAGGAPLASASIYDPATNAFTPAGSMSQARSQAVAVRLPDGRVLVAGGVPAGGGGSASADIYDPGTGAWSTSAPLPHAEAGGEAQLLPDARVIVMGGTFDVTSRTTQIYTPDPGGEPVSPPGVNCSSAGSPQPVPNPVTQPVSNAFTITRVASARDGSVVLALVVPSPGRLHAKATALLKVARKAARRRVRPSTFGSASKSLTRAGAAALRIRPKLRARRVLAGGRKLRVTVVVTFTPNGGTANSKTVRATVRKSRRRHR
jgi:hypothetical protein